jgi:DNA polymerase III subunit chi
VVAAPVEIWFYHLERASVEETLPPLLEKCVERGWRAIVRSSDPARLDGLDTLLWTYKPTAWLPHGKASGAVEEDERQPILLAAPPSAEAPADVDCQALFLLDGAPWAGVSGVARIFVVFDGRDEVALTQARADWRAAKEAGFERAYWRQNEDGKWART